MRKVTSPTPPPADLVKSENQAGIGMIDASTTESKYNAIKDYSFDLNFMSLHLNTLA